jgi:prolyl-tRNA synthetase
LRFSKTFLPTTKESPKDAVLPSHIYLVRAGFISQIGSGIYNFLPLGKIVLDKIRAVVKEELDKTGCQETLLGFVTPSSLWLESRRYVKFGKELLRFKDRKENEFVLGPTHEEAMVDLVRNKVKSYKQLPLNLYQINTKFRDEARPRYGLLRAREFLMKDGYSFHQSYEDLDREFELMQKTYSKILDRLGLKYKIVEADSGAIGGSGSKEFMVLADNGEDDIVVCDSCEYGANIEAAKRKKMIFGHKKLQTKKIHTPGVKTIEELAEFFKLPKTQFVKAVAKKAIYEDKEEIVIFFVRGSDELQETKACSFLGAIDLVDVDESELETPGFIGLDTTFKKIVDLELKDEENLITGANKKDYHLQGYSLKDKEFDYADLVTIKKGDVCPHCGGRLSITKGIEVGHIFKLGTKYSEALNATFLDKNGKSRPFIMGTYGIGVSRLVAVIVEQHHDEKGIKWTKESAPFEVVVIISDVKKEEQREFGEKLYEELKAKGVEVALDDRGERFGFKMSDFELIGIPKAVIVGKNLKDKRVQIVKRDDLQKIDVDMYEAVKRVMEL